MARQGAPLLEGRAATRRLCCAGTHWHSPCTYVPRLPIMAGEIETMRFKNRHSALRAAGRHNPRNLPCPTCKLPNKLTPADVRQGYQCDECADREEGCGFGM